MVTSPGYSYSARMVSTSTDSAFLRFLFLEYSPIDYGGKQQNVGKEKFCAHAPCGLKPASPGRGMNSTIPACGPAVETKKINRTALKLH